MLAEDLDHLHLLLVGKAGDGRLNHAANSRVVHCNKTRVVEEGNGSHDELTVHAVRHAAVSGNRVAKVLDLECALQARREETTKGRNQRGKGPKHDDMELHGHDVKGTRDGKALGNKGDFIVARNEDGVGSALEPGPDVCAQVVDGADEVLVLRHNVRDTDAPEDGEEPCAEEPLPRLLGRDLDKGGPAKGNSAEIGENVIGNDHGRGQDEPDVAFENVVDDKVRLADNEKKGHVGPCKLGKLELVVALLQREDKEDEACEGQLGETRVLQAAHQ